MLYCQKTFKKKKSTIFFPLIKHFGTSAVLHKAISVEILRFFYLASFQQSILMKENILPEYVKIVHYFSLFIVYVFPTVIWVSYDAIRQKNTALQVPYIRQSA